MVDAKKYMAASVPRFIRQTRLSYLPMGAIIASWAVEKQGDLNFVFDVIMLPETEFNRAAGYLGVPDSASPALQYGKFAPPYTPKDVKSVIVPETEPDSAAYAKAYFLKEFKREGA